MAKNKPAKAGDIQAVPWRDAEVFLCPEPGCGYAHERKDRVAQHVQAGRHQGTGPQTPPSSTTAPEPAPEAEVAQEPKETVEASTGGDS